jgi:hypothetical protein
MGAEGVGAVVSIRRGRGRCIWGFQPDQYCAEGVGAERIWRLLKRRSENSNLQGPSSARSHVNRFMFANPRCLFVFSIFVLGSIPFWIFTFEIPIYLCG